MTLYHSTGIIAASGGAAKPGMVLLTPTSIAHSGTSASIGANGQVTFTAVTSLSLNGVFSATYDNYVVSVRYVGNTDAVAIQARLRASGTDNSTASSYVYQRLIADSTSVTAARTTTNIYAIGSLDDSERSGFSLAVYGPYLAQPTAFRSVLVSGYSGAYLWDTAATHNQSTAYDGLSLIPDSGNFTGALQVYGVRG